MKWALGSFGWAHDCAHLSLIPRPSYLALVNDHFSRTRETGTTPRMHCMSEDFIEQRWHRLYLDPESCVFLIFIGILDGSEFVSANSLSPKKTAKYLLERLLWWLCTQCAVDSWLDGKIEIAITLRTLGCFRPYIMGGSRHTDSLVGDHALCLWRSNLN